LPPQSKKVPLLPRSGVFVIRISSFFRASSFI